MIGKSGTSRTFSGCPQQGRVRTGGYEPDLSGGGSRDTTILNDPSVDEEDDKAGATFTDPAHVNVTNNCNKL